MDYWNEKFNSARRGKVITKEMEADAAADQQKKFDDAAKLSPFVFNGNDRENLQSEYVYGSYLTKSPGSY